MTALETYLRELRDSRHAAVTETSFYGALANLFNEAGKTLKPKVRYVITPRGQGAGLPDGGLYTAQQLRRGATTIETTPPERGCVEAKGLSAEVERIAAGEQVEKYLRCYGQVLVTNYRDFLLVGRDENGRPLRLERYTLAPGEAEFWAAAADPRAFAREHGERFEEYLKRVMLHAAPLAAPEDVARFLASYARDARARMEKSDLPALASVRGALEEALGLQFVGADGEHFFRSTLVQTLFYGVFSAWVLWTQQGQAAGSARKFNWKDAAWTLRVPMISALFEQLLLPSRLQPLGLDEVLDWAGMTLNRIADPAAFIRKFTEGHAVQYFYEPFLQEFDPELRKQLGVWYTPQEIVTYMVARVDTVLREELNVADGLANEQVYVLDPCCGTGAYLVEVLRRIEATLRERGEDALAGERLKQAAMNRVFGFEILPAPFVVAHLQLGLLLQSLDAPLADTGAERVAVFLTNALTGWEPAREPKARLLFPEMEEERDRAEEVKRERKILVVLGNPPYNSFAGTSPAEEQGLVEPYKEGLNTTWGIRKFNLDDLYVRFFRLAERRIAEKTGEGVVCFISNYSYLSDPSFVVMRERFLSEFDALWFDSLNGDSRETGKRTPEGKPDPSVFSTEYNREGIRVGTAVGLMVRKKKRDSQPTVRYRQFWGVTKRADLLASKDLADINSEYEQVQPTNANRFSLRLSNVASNYLDWPSLEKLSSQTPFRGFLEARQGSLIDIDKAPLEERMQMYYDPSTDWTTLQATKLQITKDAARFDAKKARAKVLAAESYKSDNIRRYAIRPFDNNWCYITPVRPLWNEPRPALLAQCWKGNSFLVTRMKTEKEAKGSPIYYSSFLVDYQTIARNVSVIPLRLRNKQEKLDQAPQDHFFPEEAHEDAPTANLSTKARAYLASLGIENVDEDADKAALVWMHALAIGYAPAYLSENADGIRGDWPRVPLPASVDALYASAALGRQVAAILAYDAVEADAAGASRLQGITHTPLRPEMRSIGVVSRVGGGQLRVAEGELALNVNWGFAGQNGVMPGRGKTVERDYTPDERAAIAEGAAALGLDAGEAFARLGARTLDVYLNEVAYWKNVPARVWAYHIGGYQVVKKWLSYREREVLGRDLTPAESGEVRDMTRRIAALLLLEPALDANYAAVKATAYAWPPESVS
ncbi:MAG TPA: type ISP restriction/modification enzyme [Pyrinomonadaceae bacterium]|nr:type ISP restriction/modification enzyme [Pyrinomonadaceae bacterium]